MMAEPARRRENYTVKHIESVVKGSDVQARIFTLAPGQTIPWHYHRQNTDYYFVLAGVLSITTREPEEKTTSVPIGGTYKIAPGTAHLIENNRSTDCRFLLLQGVGTYDWVKAD